MTRYVAVHREEFRELERLVKVAQTHVEHPAFTALRVHLYGMDRLKLSVAVEAEIAAGNLTIGFLETISD